MAGDGTIQLTTEGSGKLVDTSRFSGASSSEDTYRQRVVIGGDASSSGFLNPSTAAPSSDVYALPVRLGANSTANVIGAVQLAAGTSGTTLGAVAVLAGSTDNTIGNVTVSNSIALSSGVVLGGSTAFAGIYGIAASTGAAIIDPRDRNWSLSSGVDEIAAALLAGSSATLVGSVAVSSGVVLGAGSTANALGAVAVVAGTTGTIGGVQLAPGSTATMIGTVTLSSGTQTIGVVRLPTGEGKTLSFAVIGQTVAGTSVVVAATTQVKVKVVSYAFTLSLAGTAKFVGTDDLTGAFDLAANGGVAIAGSPAAHLLETETGVGLSITTTLGAAKGHLSYFTEA